MYINPLVVDVKEYRMLLYELNSDLNLDFPVNIELETLESDLFVSFDEIYSSSVAVVYESDPTV